MSNQTGLFFGVHPTPRGGQYGAYVPLSKMGLQDAGSLSDKEPDIVVGCCFPGGVPSDVENIKVEALGDENKPVLAGSIARRFQNLLGELCCPVKKEKTSDNTNEPIWK